MNISQLKEGNTYKNYKELCKVLEVDQKTGNAKKAQIKDFECHFSFTKEGNKFIINEIYGTPRQKEDLRQNGNNASIYIEEIEELILDLLGQSSNKGQLFLSRSKLLKELKMINENFTYYRNKPIDLSNVINVSIEEINDFYESSGSALKSNLETALNRLQRQSLIYWTYALTVCFIKTHVHTTDTGYIKAIKRTYTTPEGEKITTYDTVKPVTELAYRKATKEEIQIIKRIERDTLQEFNCKDVSELFKNGKVNEYYNTVKELLFERTNIIFYYNSYEIIFNDSHIKEKLDELKLNDIKRMVSQNYLNSSVMDKMNENALKRHYNAREIINSNPFDNRHSEKVKIRSEELYKLNSEILTDTLINKDKELLEKPTIE